MQKFNTYVSVLLITLCQLAFGQQNSKKEYTIPFELTDYNNLSIQAILNEKDTVSLMFHTASSGVTLTEEAAKKLKSINFDGTVDGVKSWGGGENESRFSKGNLVQIGAMKWSNISIWEDKNSGQSTGGKFGTDLFKDKAIEIDFEKKVIVIHSDLPKKAKKYDKLKLTFSNDCMFLEATSEIGKSTFKNKFLIHSGYAGAVLFDDAFVAENKIDDELVIIDEKQLKDSFGNVLKTKKAILPSFTIGTQKLTDVPVGFFAGAIGRQKMSIIGGDVLKRFNIIIDGKREYIYLKVNNLKEVDYFN
ncbi:hypothetical protein D3C87_191500 [compost metagenome]